MVNAIRFGTLCCVVLLVWMLVGCSSRIHPLRDGDGVAILFDHGIHTRLAIPNDSGGWTEFGYGEWDWYALNEDQWYRVFGVLFWPSQSGLAYRDWPGPLSAAELRLRYAGLESMEIRVDGGKAKALRAQLMAKVMAAEGSVYNSRYQLHFLKFDERYWFFHNSNHVVAEWLEEMGARVSGPRAFAMWRLSVAQIFESAGGR